jgi:Predicted hydrolases or acyltransferases (alpha/b eta hydrolase superfamily)
MTSTLLVRGIRYALDDIGQGPLILFGHGMLFDRTMFHSQAAALSARFRCVSIDWPGHGKSEFQPEGWTADDLVEDVAALIGALGERKAILVGLSQGGAIFTRFALAYPELVHALVVMDATPFGPPVAVGSWLTDASTTLLLGDDIRIEAFFEDVLERMLSPATRRDHPEVVAAARACLRSHDRSGLARAVRLPLTYGSVVDRLSSITVPTLIAWGEHDAGSPIELARHYLCAVTGSQFVTFDGAGHSAPLETPAAVTAALDRFLADLRLE